tara:strand:+ start:397 stop:498 length:102 start_codon:yes stop_codon:yes gene_type:complete
MPWVANAKSRDQGTEAFNQYLQTKTIWINHTKK